MTTTREAALEAALKLARNRLQACAIDYPTGSREMAERSEWADEATAALSTPATEPQRYVGGLAGQDINDAICDALGDAMYCTRVWDAWHYGTMSDEDFVLVRDDAARVEEIVTTINTALAARPAPQPAAEHEYPDPLIAEDRYEDDQPAADTPALDDELATMISDLSHTGELSMLYRMEIADRITALRAALDAAEARAVGVKPLMWVQRRDYLWAAESLCGMIYITEYAGSQTPLFLDIPGCRKDAYHPTLEAAKAAAQADYEARILSAIIGTATPTPSDKIAEAARLIIAKWDADTKTGLVYGPNEFAVMLRALAGKGE